MSNSDLPGGTARLAGNFASAEHHDPDEFAAYVDLGTDGIPYIATVASSPEQAAAVTSELATASDRAWKKFLASV